MPEKLLGLLDAFSHDASAHSLSELVSSGAVPGAGPGSVPRPRGWSLHLHSAGHTRIDRPHSCAAAASYLARDLRHRHLRRRLKL